MPTSTSQKQDRDVGERTPVLPVDPATFEDTEALIKEARERQRRRRLRLLAVALILVGAAGAAFGIIRGGSGGGSAIERIPNGPTVNLAAFAGHGRLAFVSHNQLWILNGSNTSLRKVQLPTGYLVPQQPVFSHDGRWLAYLLTSPNGVTPSQLWIARSDGTDPHVVPGIRPSSLFGWSPSSDVLAVSAGPQRTRQPCPCYCRRPCGLSRRRGRRGG